MNSTPTWETVDVPRGAYISWGPRPGQVVTGKVLGFDPTGGTNANGDICPQLSLELVEATYSVSTQKGDRTDHAAGDFVVLNAAQASLKRALHAADPSPGDLLRIEFANVEATPKGTVKIFDIKIARGQGRNPQPQVQANPQPQVQANPQPQVETPGKVNPRTGNPYTADEIQAAADLGITI